MSLTIAPGTLRIFKGIYPGTRLLFQRDVDWRITGRWTLYAALVGVVTGVVGLLFSALVSLLTDLALVRGAGYIVPIPAGEASPIPAFDLALALSPARPWLLLILPAVGGLLSGWLIFKLAPEAEGHGTDAVIHAFHHKAGRIPAKVPAVKVLASALTIGTGGSAGREGPIAQIGAGIGTVIADRFKLSDRDRRILMVAGMAAGVASIFRSPLGGALFAVEVLYREGIESEALMPAVIASIASYSVFSSLSESGSVFITPAFSFVSPVELMPLTLLAVVCALVGMLFVKVFYGTKHRLFDPLRIPVALKPALGGLLVGSIAFFFPAILGSSYGWLQQAMDGTLPVYIMLALAFLKIVTTSFTISSGGSGGVFAPSLVIGGMIGGVFGTLLHGAAPELVTQPGAYVMIGMATFFTAVANTPIATTIMISELTGSYTLLVPLLLSSVTVHVMARRWSLYVEQVRTQGDSPAHRRDLVPDLLRRTKVVSVMETDPYFHELDRSHTLMEILSVFTRTREIILPVQRHDSRQGPRYSGLVLLEDVQAQLASDSSVKNILIATDLEVPFVSVHPNDSLYQVLDVFVSTDLPALPVTDEAGAIVGFVHEDQIVNEYHRAYLRWKTAEESQE